MGDSRDGWRTTRRRKEILNGIAQTESKPIFDPSKFRKISKVWFHEEQFACPSLACAESCIAERTSLQSKLGTSKTKASELEVKLKNASTEIEEMKFRESQSKKRIFQLTMEVDSKNAEAQVLKKKLRSKRKELCDLKIDAQRNRAQIQRNAENWAARRRNLQYWKDTGCLHPNSQGFQHMLANGCTCKAYKVPAWDKENHV